MNTKIGIPVCPPPPSTWLHGPKGQLKPWGNLAATRHSQNDVNFTIFFIDKLSLWEPFLVDGFMVICPWMTDSAFPCTWTLSHGSTMINEGLPAFSEDIMQFKPILMACILYSTWLSIRIAYNPRTYYPKESSRARFNSAAHSPSPPLHLQPVYKEILQLLDVC